MKFEVSQLLEIKGKVDVFTTMLDGSKDFELTDNATLGDVPIERWIEVPRFVTENGGLKKGQFVFSHKVNSDSSKLKHNFIVTLEVNHAKK